MLSNREITPACVRRQSPPRRRLSFGCPHSIRRCSMRSNSTDEKPASCGGVAMVPTIRDSVLL